MDLQSITREDILQLADNSSVYSRGKDYFTSGRVRDLKFTKNKITAKVIGSQGNYKVTIKSLDDDPYSIEDDDYDDYDDYYEEDDDSDDNDLDCQCNCPYEGYACKHIVAVLLQFLDSKPKDRITFGNDDNAADESDFSNTLYQSDNSGIPVVLKQSLAAMSQTELIKLLLKLAEENEEVLSHLLDNVPITPTQIKTQPQNPHLVNRLHNKIVDYFEQIGEAEYDDYRYYNEEPDDPSDDLNEITRAIKTLHPLDQLELYQHIFETADEFSTDYSVGSEMVGFALVGYAGALALLDLDHNAKQPHLERLIALLETNILLDITENLKHTLDSICNTKEDLHYLIKLLKKSDESIASEWVANYYLKLGDDENYLRIRNKNLNSESQFLDLANYWKAKGDQQKYIDTLESWLTKYQRQGIVPYYSHANDAKPEWLLVEYYQQQQDKQNLHRVLMFIAKHRTFTFKVYQQIKEVSKSLRHWQKDQPALIKLAEKSNIELLSQIYLFEEDWSAAIKLAKTIKHPESTITKIAEAVKEQFPKEALTIYQNLVETQINQRSRGNYQMAASYAGKMKSIYLEILNKKKDWQSYIDNLRVTYKRLPALRQELAEL